MAADVDAHRIAQHRGGRSDVGGHHGDQDERVRTELQRVAHLEHEGEHDDDGRHLVHHRRQHGREQTQDCRERHAGHSLSADDGLDDPCEKAEILQHAHDDHHAHEEQDDVEFRAEDDGLERHRLAGHEQCDADERHAHAPLPEEKRRGDDRREHGKRQGLCGICREPGLESTERHAAHDQREQQEFWVEELHGAHSLNILLRNSVSLTTPTRRSPSRT